MKEMCLRLRSSALALGIMNCMLLAALPATGQIGYVWSKTVQSPTWDDSGMDVDCDNAGNIFIAGDYGNNASFGGVPYISFGGSDHYVARMDASGAFEWVWTTGSTSTDRTFAVHAGSDGHLYAAGYGLTIFPSHRVQMHAWDAVTMRLRPDGSLHWGKSMNGGGALDFSEGKDIVSNASGDCYTVGIIRNDGWYGTDTLHGIGHDDAFVSKFDSTGDFQWARVWGGSQSDQANGVAIDRDENLWVGGSFQGNADFGGNALASAGNSDGFIAKVSPAGTVQWVKRLFGSGFSEVVRLKISADGDCYFTGNFSGSVTIGSQALTAVDTLDFFYGKMDAAGNFLWVRQAGGFDMDFVQDIEVDGEENIYLGGFFFGGLRWQTDTVTSQQYDDMYFAKTDSNGMLDLLVIAPDLDSRDLFGLAVDPAQNIIVTGIFNDTLTMGGPTHTSTLGTFDIYVAKYATRNAELRILEMSGSPYCSSDQFLVQFEALGNFDQGNVFYLELSDANGGFGAPTVVGSLTSTVGGTLVGTIPIGIVAGSNYRVRVRATTPALASPDNGQDFALDPSTAVPVAIMGDTVICNGIPVTLSVDAGFSHQVWSTGDTSATVTIASPGIIWVEATDSNGCSNRDEVMVEVCVALTEAPGRPAVSLHPNPNTGRFKVDIKGGAPGAYVWSVIDATGKTHREGVANLGRVNGGIVVEMQGLATGLYHFLVRGPGGQTSLGFILE